MDDSRIEEAAERMLAQPKAVEADGQRVENPSAGDLLKVATYLASKRATSGRRCPLRVNRMASGGAVQ